MKYWKITACLGLLIAASVSLGGWLGFRYAHSRIEHRSITESWHRRALERLNEKLKLTEPQQRRAEELMQQAIGKLHGLRDRTISEERVIIRDLVAAMETELTPEQRQEFSRMKPKSHEITIDLLRVDEKK